MLRRARSLLLLPCFSVTGPAEFQNDRVMYQSIHCGHGCHWIFKDLIPFGEYEITADPYATPFVACREKGEQYLHFFTRLLDIPKVVQDNDVIPIEFLESTIQFEISFGCQELLHELIGGAEVNSQAMP